MQSGVYSSHAEVQQILCKDNKNKIIKQVGCLIKVLYFITFAHQNLRFVVIVTISVCILDTINHAMQTVRRVPCRPHAVHFKDRTSCTWHPTRRKVARTHVVRYSGHTSQTMSQAIIWGMSVYRRGAHRFSGCEREIMEAVEVCVLRLCQSSSLETIE